MQSLVYALPVPDIFASPKIKTSSSSSVKKGFFASLRFDTKIIIGVALTILFFGILATGLIIGLNNTPQTTAPTEAPTTEAPTEAPTAAPTQTPIPKYQAVSPYTLGCQSATSSNLIPNTISWENCESSGIGCTPTEPEKEDWCNKCATPAQDTGCSWFEGSSSCPTNYLQIYANQPISDCFFNPIGVFNEKILCCDVNAAYNASYDV